MTKRLIFDPTDADTLAASDTIGSHLYAGNVLLTQTTVGAKEALDVYIANGITVNMDGVYDGSTNTDPDNVGLIGHTRAGSPGDTGQVERLTAATAASDDVVAANVRGLDVNAFGMVFDGTTWDRLRGTSGAVNIHDGGNVISVDDGAGSLTVDATDLDIRDLAAASDSVAAWVKDGSGNSISSTANALHVHIASQTGTVTVSDAALANTAIDNGATTIGDTATKVVTSDLASRKYLNLYNNGSVVTYLGKQASLSTTNGFPIFPGVYQELRAGAAIALYGICATGLSVDMRNLQTS